MPHALLAAILISGAADFEVQTLDGRTVAGTLVEFSATQIVIETPQGRSALDLSSLVAAARREASRAARGGVTAQVELVDRTHLSASEFLVAGGTARVTLASGQLEIPTRSIRWVRFSAAGDDDKQAKEWSDISESNASGDLLVTRKGETLDSLEGTVGDVDTDVCKFEVDKEVIQVRRSKVAGIVYFQPAAAELPEPIGMVTTADGSRLAMRTATLNGGVMKLATPGGVAVELPLDDITRFDFSSGKIAYLSDLEPENATFVPLVGFKEELPALREFYRFRRDTGFDQAPLRTSGKTYRKGLALASRTVLSYKLPGKFRIFKATAGIDDSVRPSGSVRLVVKGDGRSLWEGDVRGSQEAQELEVDVAGVKRLEIVADYGDDLDIGDRLDLCEARVTK